ncbi:MAG: formylmethanofuran dehydrogenase [Hyphomicrobium sp.]
MTAVMNGSSTGERAQNQAFEDVACPFCGILCDDLAISRSGDSLKVTSTSCPRAIAGFERVVAGGKPQIDGRDADLASAVAKAAALIRSSRLPLYGGLGTDVEGMRAVMAIADKTRGVVDHALSEGQMRNFRVLQTSGWFMTTLTEARNRADLFVIVGSDVNTLHPRFFERVVCAPDSMFETDASKRDVVFIGEGLDTSAAQGPRIGSVTTLPCPIDQVGNVAAALRALINGSPISGPAVAGIAVADLQALAERIRKASYGVFIWAPPSLNFPNADLAVHAVSELVKDLNKTTRSAGLSLGGNEGAVSAGAVCAWQSGYPLRVSYASGKPDYDPVRFAIPKLLADKQGDVLVWLASFTPDLAPPATDLPLIVLGTPGLKTGKPPAVFIPVGTPGADHAGRMVRCDNVVSLPMRNLGRSALPRAADILTAIEAAI